MLYRKLEKDFSQSALEEEVLALWDKEKTFHKSLELSKDRPRFNFYEGPPTANGKPGVHHVISRTVKDVMCRYKAMTGYYVERKAGWDTHGLPVEIEVEKSLGLKTKRDVIQYGIEKFNEKCKESVFRYLKDWEWITRRIAYWLDLENAYITYTPEYIETVWWILAQYHKAGLIYRGYKVLPYCARCGTGLSDHEVALGYRDAEDPSVYVLMKILSPLPDEGAVSDDTYFLVWTTTPWTLLSNLALAVHPRYEYLLVQYEDKRIIIVKERADAVLGEGKYNILRKFSGEELQGLEYEPLFRFVKPDKKCWYVITADYVTTEDGTGIVHIAPAFGKEDFDEGIRWNLPMVQLIDDEGKVKSEATPFAGMWFKDADARILDDIKKRGLLFGRGTIVHSYPFCWRCDAPLIQYARSGWYIKTTSYRDRMIEANRKIKWYPPQIGSGRFGEWLENNIDWALSRERFWGTPLNIWICNSCKFEYAPESFEDMRKIALTSIPEPFDPHKPYVDSIELKCPVCGAKMIRTPEVIDCWFDSGSMPFAQYHYPFEMSDEEFDKVFPADYIAEGVDQTRGWFYTLLAISTFLKGVSSYKTVVSIELILDKFGQKMSKSKGNVVDPVEVINKCGADPLRWYLITTSPPWIPTRFDIDGVIESYRKFFDTLRNTYSFFALYADIDGFVPDNSPIGMPENTMDRWILSRLENLVKNFYGWMEDYQMTRSARAIQSFVVDELSNWYVRRNRRRFWRSGFDEDKKTAYKVLWHSLVTVCELLAPFAPMTAEFFWRELTSHLRDAFGESVHFRTIRKPRLEFINEKLEEEMEATIKLSELGRSARNTAKINIRQPLAKMFVAVPKNTQISNELLSVMKDEINVKEIEFVPEDEAQKWSVYKAKPNFKTLGARFGSKINKAKSAIESMKSEDILLGVQSGSWHIVVDGEEHKLTADDILIEQSVPDGLSVAQEKAFYVALDTKLTPELIAEGFTRELVNRIQNTRKKAGLDVVDRINLWLYSDSEEIINSAKIYKDLIADEVLATRVFFEKPPENVFREQWDVKKHSVVIGVEKVGN